MGLLFLFLLITVIAATVQNGDQEDNEAHLVGITAVVPTVIQPALKAVTPTVVDTPTLAPTATATATPSPTSTPTSTATPTATATNSPTVTPGGPTLTPAPPTPTPTIPPLPTPKDAYSWTLKVPILMYHYISVPPEDADIYRVDLSVEPDDFRLQMAYLAQNGYNPIDLYDLSLAITNKIELPPKPVVITLDDGYRDNYENAFPILQEYGFKATFFIVTEFVDEGYEAYMTWPMIEEMAAAGMRMEPHSRTHPDLRGQERDFLIWQILGPQETLAAHIGYLPRYFAYPAGRYDEGVITILRELDFWGAVTTLSGKWQSFDGRYEWVRLRVRHNTPLPEFIDLVDPGDTIRGKQIP